MHKLDLRILQLVFPAGQGNSVLLLGLCSLQGIARLVISACYELFFPIPSLKITAIDARLGTTAPSKRTTRWSARPGRTSRLRVERPSGTVCHA